MQRTIWIEVILCCVLATGRSRSSSYSFWHFLLSFFVVSFFFSFLCHSTYATDGGVVRKEKQTTTTNKNNEKKKRNPTTRTFVKQKTENERDECVVVDIRTYICSIEERKRGPSFLYSLVVLSLSLSFYHFFFFGTFLSFSCLRRFLILHRY
jgi:hypothetical protein